jgi:hypothetical protein
VPMLDLLNTGPEAPRYLIRSIMRSTLRRLGIADLSSTLCTQQDIRLIVDPWQIVMLQTFCEEHYRVRPAYNLVFDNQRTHIFMSGQPEMRK